jgi:hypothetical protein
MTTELIRKTLHDVKRVSAVYERGLFVERLRVFPLPQGLSLIIPAPISAIIRVAVGPART